jgi:hypothetical protein
MPRRRNPKPKRDSSGVQPKVPRSEKSLAQPPLEILDAGTVCAENLRKNYLCTLQLPVLMRAFYFFSQK